LWRSILLDLAFLLGEHAAASLDHGRWTFAGELAPGEPLTAAAPLVAYGTPGLRGHQPGRLGALGLLHQCAGTVLVHRLGRSPDRPAPLGDVLRTLQERSTVADGPVAALVAWLQRHLDEDGDLPASAEVAAHMVDAEPPPEALPERFRALPDWRERRR
jgi:hypothetical protein